MKLLPNLFALCSMALACGSCSDGPVNADYGVIPLPQQIEMRQGGAFTLDGDVVVTYCGDEAMRRNAEFLADYIHESTGLLLKVREDGPLEGAIHLALGLEAEKDEAYRLTVRDKHVLIEGKTPAGVFYGVQTLRKSLPAGKFSEVDMPQVEICDYPRFGYRGMMLDVSRHFFSVDEVKTFIDLLALHNINRFHWHLTDDQGWRIEIKSRPELAKLGSVRAQTVIGRNSGKYDGLVHEGFYTQKQLREVVDYAAKRYITVIPEVDMPGHMQGALACYPELGCTGGPYKVRETWGVSDDVLCAGNPKTLAFVKEVLSEVMEIFPSKYIHIGGDECPKTRWSACPKCQRKIRELGLFTDLRHTKEERLQSYFISEVEKFLNAHGRQIIGWDEILEGGLAPNATVMAWRGVDRGIEAINQRHDVIMTPTSHLYFDYYQSDDTDAEPLAIGGYLPVERVYSFDPAPAASMDAEHRAHVLGTQANLWTEYIPSFNHVIYMSLPRMDALCEVQWCEPERKNYDEFLVRMGRMFRLYDHYDCTDYAKHLLDVSMCIQPADEAGTLTVTLSQMLGEQIVYTLDGSEPTASSKVYEGPFPLTSSCTVKARTLRHDSRTVSREVSFSKSTACPVKLLSAPHPRYAAAGAAALTDGQHGRNNYRTPEWLGFYDTDFEAVVDLQQEKEVSLASLSLCVCANDNVFDTRGIEVSVSSDGEQFETVAVKRLGVMQEDFTTSTRVYDLKFNACKCRYVKVKAQCEHSIPAWNRHSTGKPAFLFVDEIEID